MTGMFDTADYLRALTPGESSETSGLALIDSVQFEHPVLAWKRLQSIARDSIERGLLARTMPALLAVLEEAATPDLSVVNLDRFLQSRSDMAGTLQFLADNPRSVEILVRLFVGSQYLTEVLLQNPDYLERLTQYKRLAEIKSRHQFFEEGLAVTSTPADWSARMTALRHFQKWELLRIAACDTFGLMDFKATTLQLSLLADGIVQLALRYCCEEQKLQAPDFCVLAMGKLGGEELNYSSDIDLVFVCETDGGIYSALAQRLIRGLSDMTATGFLYRVDMRLRPWGRAGALVTTRDAYLEYIRKDGRLWEKQALLKARPIAGNMAVGHAVLKGLAPQIYQVDPEVARKSVLTMKREIEDKLATQGLLETEIKGGRGGIRDIEFTAQYLQLVHGGENPSIHSINTLDGLVRLVDSDLIQADEYRQRICLSADGRALPAAPEQ
jgi:glutamate-ammonia-ligase adenylyltransferase